MLRKTFTFLMVMLVAAICPAEPLHSVLAPVLSFSNGTDTNTALSVTGIVMSCTGPLLQVNIDEQVAGADVDIDITIMDGNVPTMTEKTVYSADDVTADTTLYPVFDRTDTAGAALTSDEPGLHYLTDDHIKIVVTDWNATGKVINVTLIWENRKPDGQ